MGLCFKRLLGWLSANFSFKLIILILTLTESGVACIRIRNSFDPFAQPHTFIAFSGGDERKFSGRMTLSKTPGGKELIPRYAIAVYGLDY